MEVARVTCGIILRVELYDGADTFEVRAEREASLLEKAIQVVEDIGNAATALVGLSAEPSVLERGKRPTLVLGPFAPVEWTVVYNSFRQADELEVRFPLSLLPVPLTAIRVISCFAAIDQRSDKAWEQAVEGAEGGEGFMPRLAPDLSNADFAGVGLSPKSNITSESDPMLTVKFHDFTGLLAGKKVRPGHEIDEGLPVSKSIEKFLKGTPAEGLEVVWVDPAPEPVFGKYKPRLFKKQKGAKAAQAASSQHTYLDAITEACIKVGAIARVNVGRLEIAFAGTLYDGATRSGDPTKATIVLGEIVEDFEHEHRLVGVGTEAVQVYAYDPDRDLQYTARWPEDPKAKGVRTVKPGEHVGLKPLRANLGLPGIEQMDESIVPVPLGPVSDPALLPKIAQAIFLERTRQRGSHTLTTHSPTSNPHAAEPATGDLLRLRAGDVVRFGVALPTDSNMIPSAVHVLGGNVGEDGIAQALRDAGVPKKAAAELAKAIAATPRVDRFRVDTLKVSGGVDKDAVLELKLQNYVVIDGDFEAKAIGEDPNAVLAKLKDLAVVLPGFDLDAIKAAFKKARKAIADADLSPAEEAARMREIDTIERQVMERWNR